MFSRILRRSKLPNAGKRFNSSSAGQGGGLRSKRSPLITFSAGVSLGLSATALAYYVYGQSEVPGSRSSTLPLSALKSEPLYASVATEKAAIAEIKKIVGDENVSDSEEDLLHHADSNWQTRHRKAHEVPITVVSPNSTEEISQILKICNDNKIPVTAFSGGTSLEGHFTPVYGGISLDMNRMNKVIAVHKADLDVVVQPAVGWEELRDTLQGYDLMFGPDPGPGAQIGGMVSTCCSGTNAYRYGTMRQNVVNLTVVLADGTVIKTRRRPRKTAAGYSLTDLFIGAEGTLGIVTEATLKVTNKPKVVRVGILTFKTIEDATDTVQSVLQSGLQLDAIELMDDGQMRLVNESGMTDRKWSETFTLLVRFAGTTKTAVQEQVKHVEALSKEHNSLALEFARNEDESEELWSARKNALWSVGVAAPKGYKLWTTDLAVPISSLSTIISETKTSLEKNNLLGGILGHVGDGNFHAIIAYDPQTQRQLTADVVDSMTKRALELDGTVTGEHGVGAGKRHYLLEELGAPTIDAMRKIKIALDPSLILNPGKVFAISPDHDVSDH